MALRPVPNYTAWQQRHVCEQLAQSQHMKEEWPEVESVASNCESNALTYQALPCHILLQLKQG